VCPISTGPPQKRKNKKKWGELKLKLEGSSKEKPGPPWTNLEGPRETAGERTGGERQIGGMKGTGTSKVMPPRTVEGSEGNAIGGDTGARGERSVLEHTGNLPKKMASWENSCRGGNARDIFATERGFGGGRGCSSGGAKAASTNEGGRNSRINSDTKGKQPAGKENARCVQT